MDHGHSYRTTSATFLAGLPLTLVSGDFTLVHGSLREPVWEYLLDAEQAEAQFALPDDAVQPDRALAPPVLGRGATGPRPAFRRAAEGSSITASASAA